MGSTVRRSAGIVCVRIVRAVQPAFDEGEPEAYTECQLLIGGDRSLPPANGRTDQSAGRRRSRFLRDSEPNAPEVASHDGASRGAAGGEMREGLTKRHSWSLS
jgi:hypothetical protein